jgi:hypothetical protein
LCSSTNTSITVSESGRMRRAGHVACMIGMFNAYTNFSRIPEGKRLFGIIRSWDDNTEKDLIEIGCAYVNRINFARDTQWEMKDPCEHGDESLVP